MNIAAVTDLEQQGRVVVVQRSMGSIRTGIPKQVLNEIALLTELNNQVYLLAQQIDQSLLNLPNLQVLKITGGFWGSRERKRLVFNSLAMRAVGKLQPDLLIGHGDIIESDVCFLHNCVHLAAELIPDSKLNDSAIIHAKILQKQSFKLLIANSKLMQRDFTQRFALPTSSSKVLYPSYDSAKFYPRSINKSLRADLGFPAQAFVFGFITSGNYRKRNLDVLLQALAYGRKQGINSVYLLVAGSDKAKDYKKQVQLTGLGANVIFAPAIDAVEDYYHSVDAFVLPAHLEEFGRSLIEAAACAKPIICSTNIGATEILPQCLCLSSQDPIEWWQAIASVVANKESYQQKATRQAQDLKPYANEHSRQLLLQLLQELD